jgi:hypothetical protein
VNHQLGDALQRIERDGHLADVLELERNWARKRWVNDYGGRHDQTASPPRAATDHVAAEVARQADVLERASEYKLMRVNYQWLAKIQDKLFKGWFDGSCSRTEMLRNTLRPRTRKGKGTTQADIDASLSVLQLARWFEKRRGRRLRQ